MITGVHFGDCPMAYPVFPSIFQTGAFSLRAGHSLTGTGLNCNEFHKNITN